MEPFVVGLFSLIAIIVLIYGGCYVAIALSLVSFFGVWFIKEDPVIAVRMMTLAVNDANLFGVLPQVGVLAAFAVVLLGLATWRLRAALAG